jgi:hypothetical protein
MTDAAEKVRGMATERNNRIVGATFLNRICAYSARLESILLADCLKIFFRQLRPNRSLVGRELRNAAGS